MADGDGDGDGDGGFIRDLVLNGENGKKMKCYKTDEMFLMQNIPHSLSGKTKNFITLMRLRRYEGKISF